jgi:hypothetical protein
MADRRDFYYRQKVLEEELDAAYEGLENAERALASDLDFVGRTPPSTKADFGGIVWGLDVTFGGGLNIIVAAGAAYGELGIRAHVPSDTTVTLSSQGDTQIGQGGTGDGAPIALASGTECWVTVFLRFDRLLSDQRYDGYNNLVYHQRDESFYFTLEQGTPRTIGSLTVGDKPARKLYHTLLADVHMKNTGGGIFIDSIDTGDDTQRTEWYFDYEATNPIYGNPARRIHAKKNIRDALAQMLEYYNDHAAGLEDKHQAIDILWTAAEAWADGESVSATDVYNALNEIIADLAVKQPSGTASSGSRKIGTRAAAGGAGYIDSGSPYSIPQTTVQDVLEQLTEQVNGRVFRGGDSSVDYLYPRAIGTELGDPAGNKWDAYLRDLVVDRYLQSALIPEIADDNSFDLGTASARFRNLFLGTSLTNDGVTQLNDNLTVEGYSTFEKRVEIQAPYADHGLVVTQAGAATDGGYIFQMQSKVLALNSFMKVDKFGHFSHTPHFIENFQHYAQKLASSSLATHVPDTRWEGFSGFSTPSYQIVGGGSNSQGLQVFGTVPETGPKTVGLSSGPQWEIGQARGIAAMFEMGPAYTGIPQATELIVGGFTGVFYGVEILIRMDLNGAWGYFDNGTSIAYGATNLMTGPPVANGRYTFRILILDTNTVAVQGPNGWESLVPSSGSMNAAEVANFDFYFSRASGAYAGRGANFHYLCVSEQETRDLG